MNNIPTDCLSVCTSFLTDADFARLIRTNSQLNKQAGELARARLADLGIMLESGPTNPSKLLNVLEICASYPSNLLNAIGNRNLANIQRIETSKTNDALSAIGLDDHSGPVAFGRDQNNTPFLSFHLQSKDNPDLILTCNIFKRAYWNGEKLQRGSFNVMLNQEYKGVPINANQIDALCSPLRMELKHLSEEGMAQVRRIFENQHPTTQLYSAQATPSSAVTPPPNPGKYAYMSLITLAASVVALKILTRK